MRRQRLRFYENLGFSLTGLTDPYPHDPALMGWEMAQLLIGFTCGLTDLAR